MQTLPVAIPALTLSSSWRPLISIPRGISGWVECRAYDAFIEVRRVRQYDEGIYVIERDSDNRPRRIGPAGSAHAFRIDDGALIEYRVRQVFNTGEHADPGNGVFSSNSTKDARVTARFCPQRPETYEEYCLAFGASSGVSADAAAITAAATSARVYPTGYCRRFAFYGVSPTGTLDMRSPLLDSLAAGGVWDVQTYEEALAASGSGAIAAWQALVISNDHASTALTCSLSFRSPEGG